MSSTLLSLFRQISDPRRDQGKMYPLAPILLFTVLAMLAGTRSYRQVHATGKDISCASTACPRPRALIT